MRNLQMIMHEKPISHPGNLIDPPLGKAFLVVVVVVAFVIFVAPSGDALLPLLPVRAVLPLPVVHGS